MYTIRKISAHPTIDFAAEELKKYLRMMMPHCGEIPILSDGSAGDGFRLGLMSDFGLDVSDAQDPCWTISFAFADQLWRYCRSPIRELR